jgi:hypothetical protein
MSLRWQISFMSFSYNEIEPYEWYMHKKQVHEDLPHNQFSCLRSKVKDLAGSKNQSNVCNTMMTTLSHALVFIDVSKCGDGCGGGVCVCLGHCLRKNRRCISFLNSHCCLPAEKRVGVGWGGDDSHRKGERSENSKRKFGAMKAKLKSLEARPLFYRWCINNKNLQIFHNLRTGKTVDNFGERAPSSPYSPTVCSRRRGYLFRFIRK